MDEVEWDGEVQMMVVHHKCPICGDNTNHYCKLTEAPPYDAATATELQ